MGKHSQIDFDCGLIDGARWAGLNISETADLLGFLWMTVSRVHREWCEKIFSEKAFSEHFCGLKGFVDVRGQKRAVRLIAGNRKTEKK